MGSTRAGPDESRGAFLLDGAALDRGRRLFGAFRREWVTQLGDGFPLPGVSPATAGDFRVRARVTRVRDTAVADLHGVSAVQTAGSAYEAADQVKIFVVRRGTWTFGIPSDRDQYTVPAGQFLVRRLDRPSHFQTHPNTTAKVVMVPADLFKPLVRDRIVTGPAGSAELRLLAAHANMIHATAAGLGPAGMQAARDTLVELARAVARGRFDDAEPQLAPALALAAKELADRRLADPGLSPAVLARELNVSVRTLQRAFAAAGESVTGYIRHRRLEEARLALTAPSSRPSITELAARWQFADSSHFVRAFKKYYGATPAEYARQGRARA